MGLLDDIVDLIYRLFGFRKVVATSFLDDQSSMPVAGKTVSLSYERVGGTWTSDGSAMTDSTGKAVNHVRLRSGTYNFKATFSGNEKFNASSAEKDGVSV